MPKCKYCNVELEFDDTIDEYADDDIVRKRTIFLLTTARQYGIIAGARAIACAPNLPTRTPICNFFSICLILFSLSQTPEINSTIAKSITPRGVDG